MGRWWTWRLARIAALMPAREYAEGQIVAHQPPVRGQLDAEREGLTFARDLPAAQVSGQPCSEDLLVHRLEGQVSAHLGAT